MSDDLILDLAHHVGKQVASVHVMGDKKYYDERNEYDEGLDHIVVTFTDGTRLVTSYWSSEMGGLIIDEGEKE
jgi:hypothetical protein